MERLVEEISDIVGVAIMLLLAYNYGYWKGRVHGTRKVDPNKPRKSTIKTVVEKIRPHADPPVPAVTGLRRPEYTRPGVGEEEL